MDPIVNSSSTEITALPSEKGGNSGAENPNKRLKLDDSDVNLSTNKPDVFLIPHSRMRELVTWPLKEAASVPDVQDLQPSLQAVYEAMWELKSHEIIENEYIMGTLKARLQARQVIPAIKEMTLFPLLLTISTYSDKFLVSLNELLGVTLYV